MGFHVLVTVSSVGSCDFDRLISFLLVLCEAVEHGRSTPRHSHQATLRTHRSTPFHSRYANLQSLQQCAGVLPLLSSRAFYNQKKKMVFLPVYRRSLTSFTQVHPRRPQCPTSFFLFPKLSKVNSVKEKHHLTKSAFIFFIKKSTSFAEQNVSRHSNLKIRTGM